MGVSRKWEGERLTRRAAARAEIDTAIDLFLGHSDHVSAHVLAWAATEMLRGIATAQLKQTFQSILEDWIKSEYLNEWRANIKKAYNFSKHADRDPDSAIDDFRPESTSYVIFGACHDYSMLHDQKSWSMLVFQNWFQCRNPRLAIEPLRTAIPSIAKSLGLPAEVGFRESTREAHEILHEGMRNAARIRQSLPVNWQPYVEW